MREGLESVYKQLEKIATWPENWNSYRAVKPDTQAIADAKDWITALYVFVAHDSWIEPSVFPDASDGTITFVWERDERKLDVYMDKGQYEAIQVTVLAPLTLDFVDRHAMTIEDCVALWTWLIEENVQEDTTPNIVSLTVAQFADVLIAAR